MSRNAIAWWSAVGVGGATMWLTSLSTNSASDNQLFWIGALLAGIGLYMGLLCPDARWSESITLVGGIGVCLAMTISPAAQQVGIVAVFTALAYGLWHAPLAYIQRWLTVAALILLQVATGFLDGG